MQEKERRSRTGLGDVQAHIAEGDLAMLDAGQLRHGHGVRGGHGRIIAAGLRRE
jgi:hypothetical protein